MQLRFHCKKCDLPMRISRWETLGDFRCPRCEEALPVETPAERDSARLDHCLVCRCPELFKQKLFNRNLGIGIVVVGIVASFFASIPVVPLVVVGLIDVILFWVLPMMLVCYRCDAEFRGFPIPEKVELYNHLKAAKVKNEPVYPGAEEAH